MSDTNFILCYNKLKIKEYIDYIEKQQIEKKDANETIIFSDIHGDLLTLMRYLSEAGIEFEGVEELYVDEYGNFFLDINDNKDESTFKKILIPKIKEESLENICNIVALGDYIDRGVENLEILILLKRLKQLLKEKGLENKLDILFGNHEADFRSILIPDYRKEITNFNGFARVGRSYINEQDILQILGNMFFSKEISVNKLIKVNDKYLYLAHVPMLQLKYLQNLMKDFIKENEEDIVFYCNENTKDPNLKDLNNNFFSFFSNEEQAKIKNIFKKVFIYKDQNFIKDLENNIEDMVLLHKAIGLFEIYISLIYEVNFLKSEANIQYSVFWCNDRDKFLKKDKLFYIQGHDHGKVNNGNENAISVDCDTSRGLQAGKDFINIFGKLNNLYVTDMKTIITDIIKLMKQNNKYKPNLSIIFEKSNLQFLQNKLKEDSDLYQQLVNIIQKNSNLQTLSSNQVKDYFGLQNTYSTIEDYNKAVEEEYVKLFYLQDDYQFACLVLNNDELQLISNINKNNIQLLKSKIENINFRLSKPLQNYNNLSINGDLQLQHVESPKAKSVVTNNQQQDIEQDIDSLTRTKTYTSFDQFFKQQQNNNQQQNIKLNNLNNNLYCVEQYFNQQERLHEYDVFYYKYGNQ